jgi:hypothetical protein
MPPSSRLQCCGILIECLAPPSDNHYASDNHYDISIITDERQPFSTEDQPIQILLNHFKSSATQIPEDYEWNIDKNNRLLKLKLSEIEQIITNIDISKGLAAIRDIINYIKDNIDTDNQDQIDMHFHMLSDAYNMAILADNIEKNSQSIAEISGVVAENNKATDKVLSKDDMAKIIDFALRLYDVFMIIGTDNDDCKNIEKIKLEFDTANTAKGKIKATLKLMTFFDEKFTKALTVKGENQNDTYIIKAIEGCKSSIDTIRHELKDDTKEETYRAELSKAFIDASAKSQQKAHIHFQKQTKIQQEMKEMQRQIEEQSRLQEETARQLKEMQRQLEEKSRLQEETVRQLQVQQPPLNISVTSCSQEGKGGQFQQG